MGMLLPLASACGATEPTNQDLVLKPAQFIDIVVAIRQAEPELADHDDESTVREFERRKAEILKEHGATEEALRNFVDRHYRRPGVLAAVWDSIANRLMVTAPDDEPDQWLLEEEAW